MVETSCPAGKVIYGGGVAFVDSLQAVDGLGPLVIGSGPVSNTTWRVNVQNLNKSRGFDYLIFLTCAFP